MTQCPKCCIYEGLIFNNAFYFIRYIYLNAESESQGEKQNSPTLHLQLSLTTTTFGYLDLYQFHPGYSIPDFVSHWSSPTHLSICRRPKAVLCESESQKIKRNASGM